MGKESEIFWSLSPSGKMIFDNSISFCHQIILKRESYLHNIFFADSFSLFHINDSEYEIAYSKKNIVILS
jgi:hypothetical protein